MNLNEHQNNGSGVPVPPQLTNTKEIGTPKIESPKPPNRTSVALKDVQVLVSDQQFETVKREISESLNLLNSSGSALLKALELMVPPENSTQVVGEYRAQGIRQLSKSICEMVLTKQQIIKACYAIARDEI